MTQVHSADRFAELTRACLQTGGAVSYQSAAQVYAMGDFHPHYVHVTATGSVGAIGTVAVHREALEPDDVCDLGPFRLTTPLRTVLDLVASPVAQTVLDRVVADGVAIGRLDAHELAVAAASLPDRGAVRLRRSLLATD